MKFLKLLFTLLAIGLGGVVGYQFSHLLNLLDIFSQNPSLALLNDFTLTTVGILVGFLVAPYFFQSFLQYFENFTKGMEKRTPLEILLGTGGLIVGLILSSLIALTLVDPIFSYFVVKSREILILRPLFITLFTLFFTTMIFLLTIRLPFFGKGFHSRSSRPKILDTSAVIDGRIADVMESGFAEGVVIVPQFVLEELQKIADSTDALKRKRGRRGLDILNRMRQSKLIDLQISDRNFSAPEVDRKLLQLAQEINGTVVTNDYNLNKVAQLQGIPILNINELAGAVKPVILPGEDLKVQVVREGKEQNQGIGYLDDGTMVVLEGARRRIGDTVDAEVTSVLQTTAGKMIFARPR